MLKDDCVHDCQNLTETHTKSNQNFKVLTPVVSMRYFAEILI